MWHLFCNALVHVIHSVVLGQYTCTISQLSLLFTHCLIAGAVPMHQLYIVLYVLNLISSYYYNIDCVGHSCKVCTQMEPRRVVFCGQKTPF